VRKWLAESGFTIERQLTVSHFRMGLFKRLIPLKLLVAMDSALQFTGNWWQLSPSVFVRARTAGQSPAPAGSGFFACPECGHTLPAEGSEALACPACARRWTVRDGIYDFRKKME